MEPELNSVLAEILERLEELKETQAEILEKLDNLSNPEMIYDEES